MLNVTLENIRGLALLSYKGSRVRWGVMSSCTCQCRSQAPDTALPKPAKTSD